jgi:hypothetical protein
MSIVMLGEGVSLAARLRIPVQDWPAWGPAADPFKLAEHVRFFETMNHVRFDIVQYRPDWGQWQGILPLVDGVSLVKLVYEFESLKGWKPAGGYAGISIEHSDLGRLTRSLLGGKHPEYDDEDTTWLLGCDCSVAGCWPLEAKVTVAPDVVIWNSFRQPFRREWDYLAFGPFTFDRRQYGAAVEELAQSLSGDSEVGTPSAGGPNS